MKPFCNFSELDSYFLKLFSDEEGIFSQLKYENIPVGIAMQHNIYDYYKTFIYTPKVKLPIFQKMLSLARIYGLDHRFKLIINNFLWKKSSPLSKGKTIFFADNYVPRILEDFLKVITEMESSSVAFVTTDYRAYIYMRKKAAASRLQVSLLASGSVGYVSSLTGKSVLDDTLLFKLQREFNGSAKKIFKIINRNLRVLVGYYNLFDAYLEQAKPSKIVLGSDGFSIARILCFAARRKQIDTYVLQHGLIDSLNGYLPLVADYIFSWSHFEKAFFQRNGVAPQRLIVTGSPRFQQEHHSTKIGEYSLKNNQLLFVISPATPQDVYSQIDQVMEIQRHLVHHYTIIIRPHPYYKRIAKTYFDTLEDRADIVLDEQPFLQSLISSRLVIFTEISTGIFEALSLNKEVCILSNPSESKVDIYNFPRIEMAALIAALNLGFDSLKRFDLYGGAPVGEILPANVKSSVAIASYLNCV